MIRLRRLHANRTSLWTSLLLSALPILMSDTGYNPSFLPSFQVHETLFYAALVSHLFSWTPHASTHFLIYAISFSLQRPLPGCAVLRISLSIPLLLWEYHFWFTHIYLRLLVQEYNQSIKQGLMYSKTHTLKTPCHTAFIRHVSKNSSFYHAVTIYKTETRRLLSRCEVQTQSQHLYGWTADNQSV
jgi:hypothetical protein